MAITLHYAKKEDIPKRFEEDDYEVDPAGGFRAKGAAAGGYSIDKVDGLKSAHGTVKGERDDLKKKVAEYVDDDGQPLDAKAARQAIKTVAELGDDADIDARIKAGADARVQQVTEKLTGELTTSKKREAELISHRDVAMIDTAILTQLERTDGDRTSPIGRNEVLVTAMRPSFRVVEKDGEKPRVIVIDPANGQALMSKKTDDQTDMGVEERVERWRSGDYSDYFKASDKGGTDTSKDTPPRRSDPAPGAGGGSGNKDDKPIGNPVHRLDAEYKANPEKYGLEAPTRANP